MSRERGFLASFDPGAVELPLRLQPVREMARAIPQLICTGRVRALLERLPLMDLNEFCATASEAEQRIAMLHYSFMVQTYVWGEAEAPRALPACLAVPIWQLGKSLGQPPLLPYSSYTLENWTLIDPDGSIDLSNVRILQHFDGGMDEAWFILIHVAIEARAGEMLDEALNLIRAADAADPAEAGRCLSA
ncbi:MAG TPA: indoleamine 2,3-dioxygenase, partial [Hyphomonas adhaerens]|nr:indoleamine 2,3-dioxygenase [Hyphomonas adhaerens]